ncbi:MAG TPA: hypothetical protein PK082_04635 [Phycisphaerae bacterium]|nr:hypothetical protein [Phycisphaerae bacterium]
MSLINEALKRAEEDAQNRSGGGIEAKPAPMEPVRQAKGRKFKLTPSRMVMLAALVAACGAGWYFTRGPSPASRPAAAKADGAAHKNTKTTAAKPKANQNDASAKAQTDAALKETAPRKIAPVAPVNPELERAYARLIETATYYTPPPRQITMPASAPAGDETAKSESPATAPASGEAPASAKAQSAIAAATKPPAKAPAGKTPPVAAAKATPSKGVDYSRYQLSGVMHGPNGTTAIINGYFLTVGQEIDGAKILRIEQQSVLLELDGQRFTIRM